MTGSEAQALSDEALDALRELFTQAISALAECERIAASSLTDQRDLPLRLTDFYRNLSGQIAAILAADGKAVDVVGSWISARNRAVAEIHARRPETGQRRDDLLRAAAAPVFDAFAGSLAEGLPLAVSHELMTACETLAELLADLRGLS